ncbi:ATP-dependent DNA ligase [Leifsonia sp. NPDC058248]|uniref:DUF7882 family protein n=1 Tax=Leifsonia sp. NPDC058248 TaxID=3346402 RepID=UPI0036DEA7B8
MGTLTYAGTRIDFPDRLLAHLQVVIVNKLRRREGFAMSWQDPEGFGEGRSAIWLDASIPLFFKFEGPRQGAISRPWLARLADTANATSGLLVVEEETTPDPETVVRKVSEYT